MTKLTHENFRQAIATVNEIGFAAIDLSDELPSDLGAGLYSAMDRTDFHAKRTRYYNEIEFYFPEDWTDVELGIGAFHEEKSLKNILTATAAVETMSAHFGNSVTEKILEFVKTVKNLTVETHTGLPNNELRLARVMLRQMNETNNTQHGGASLYAQSGRVVAI